MTTQPPTFDVFAIVELFGHARIAGRVTEQVIAGQGFIRVDVPDLPTRPAFTRLFGPSAIYSITPVSEEIATAAAHSMRVEPVNVYIALPSKVEDNMGDDYDQNDWDEDDDDEGIPGDDEDIAAQMLADAKVEDGAFDDDIGDLLLTNTSEDNGEDF